MTKLDTFISTGLITPYGLAFYKDCLYVSNTKRNTITQITPDGIVSVYIANGLCSPTGIVFDKKGNLYVANSNTSSSNGFILKISHKTHVSTVILSGLCYPTSLAIDTRGNLYVANNGDSDSSGTIMKLLPNGKKTTFVSGLHYPNCLSFDKYGFLYVSCDDNTIKQVTPKGAVSIYVSGDSGLQYPNGLLFYGNNLYVSCYGTIGDSTGAVYRVSKKHHDNTPSVFVYTHSLPHPTNLAVDCQGHLYIGYQTKNEIQKTNKPLIKNWFTM
jgi:DNA-binding beta-propeller fold protein YncE